MLAIRLKRIGRANDAFYRLIVQDSRRHPTRGKVVAYLGTFDPHAKTVTIDKDETKRFLSNGAQPSQTAARLLKKEGVKLPSWVSIEKQPKKTTRNPEKLRKNRPAGAEAPAVKSEEPKAKEQPAAEIPAEPVVEEAKLNGVKTEETPKEAIEAEAPVETKTEIAPTEEKPAEKAD
ncbi:MAG TPA: 30S ribosomal protein S16 [Candidatus Saccharimonadales bacterium]